MVSWFAMHFGFSGQAHGPSLRPLQLLRPSGWLVRADAASGSAAETPSIQQSQRGAYWRLGVPMIDSLRG